MNTPFEAIKISDRVYWVGAIDTELRDFHGYETTRGSTYNAFLITGEKNILIDTVKAPFFEEMMSRISSVINPEKIDYIISNHAEMDHSGSLPATIKAVKPEKVFASKMGAKALHDHFHWKEEITELSNTEQLILGNAHFTFIETRMLHWPDSMFTFFEEDGVLFSQDGFGQHLAVNHLFADQNSKTIMRYEAAKYFANILLPYSHLVKKLFDALPSLNLDIKLIAPDHGPLFRTPEDISWILNLWKEWAEQAPKNKVVIVYDTMWGSTAKMGKAIAEGISQHDTEVIVMPLSGYHRSDIVTEILEAGALLIGSPTINQQILPRVADVVCYLQGLKPKYLIGQVFGSYGWSGESTKLLSDIMKTMQIKCVDESIKTLYVPTFEQLQQCRQLGNNIAITLKEEIDRWSTPTQK